MGEACGTASKCELLGILGTQAAAAPDFRVLISLEENNINLSFFCKVKSLFMKVKLLQKSNLVKKKESSCLQR